MTAGLDGTARIWDLETHDELLRLAGHAGAVERAVWGPDGASVVTGGADGTIRFWDSTTGELLLVLRAHHGMVIGLAIDPGGRKIASSGEDGLTRVWAIDVDDLIGIATSRVSRSFTVTECVTYHIERCQLAPEDGDAASGDTS